MTGAPPKCSEKRSLSIVADVMMTFRSGRCGRSRDEVPEQEVDVEAALVRLVDDDRVVPAQEAVALDLGQQQAVGDEPDERVVRRLVLEADGVANRRPERDVELVGDSLRDGAGGDATGLRVGDRAVDAPAELEAQLRELGRLARAGLPGDDDDLVCGDGGAQVVEAARDRKLRRKADRRQCGSSAQSPGRDGRRVLGGTRRASPAATRRSLGGRGHRLRIGRPIVSCLRPSGASWFARFPGASRRRGRGRERGWRNRRPARAGRDQGETDAKRERETHRGVRAVDARTSWQRRRGSDDARSAHFARRLGPGTRHGRGSRPDPGLHGERRDVRGAQLLGRAAPGDHRVGAGGSEARPVQRKCLRERVAPSAAPSGRRTTRRTTLPTSSSKHPRARLSALWLACAPSAGRPVPLRRIR